MGSKGGITSYIKGKGRRHNGDLSLKTLSQTYSCKTASFRCEATGSSFSTLVVVGAGLLWLIEFIFFSDGRDLYFG